MKVKDLLSLPWKNMDRALEYGVEECKYLGKTLLGITLSNGTGFIIYFNPYTEEIYRLLIMSSEKKELGEFFGVFKYEGGNTFFIYTITNLTQIVNSFGEIEVDSVEVIKDVFEDFLLEALARQ
jgi:hypothetical protein